MIKCVSIMKMRKPVSNAFLILLFFTACNGPQHKKQNRLQYASSPYLKEHADNPVDWYEWGDEALEKARKENKPLLVSIGYASCHWCHEMEKESFMDTAVARVMNENFICIKVDREERPDIDNIYMNALQLLSGDTGWPLNAFALPDGKPFFAGSYYAKQNWINLLLGVSKAFKTKHNLVVTQAEALMNGIAEQDNSLIEATTSSGIPVRQAIPELYDSIYKQADRENGGLKGAPKFPTPAYADFLIQHHYITGDQQSLEAALLTLKKMALGGIYDQVGGGFARYATDSLWRIPHFEKMLYDNGQLATVYAHAYQLTKDDLYKDVLTETLAFVERSLAAPGGGYYSSLDADTEDGEGTYYAWKKAEFNRVTKGDNSLAAYFHITEEGNWKAGANILFASLTPAEYASGLKIPLEEFKTKLASAKSSLLNEREKRIRPTVDTKIITSWNCMVLKAYADAYAATGNDDYLLKARSCAAFIEKNLLAPDGSLNRIFKDGKAHGDGFLDDYAWAAAAFSRLYQVGFDSHWMYISKQLADHAISNFYNAKTGLFFYLKEKDGLVLRNTEVADNAIPSSNAVLAKVLYTIGVVYDDTSYTEKALEMYRAVKGRIKAMPRFHLEWCSFAELISARSYEVVIMGKDAVERNKELQRNYLPACIICGSKTGEDLPLLKDKTVADKTLIYVCTDKLCKKPEELVADALAQIKH